jgi:hypothetical protein
MIKLIWFWLLGKTLKLDIVGYSTGKYIVSQITVNCKYEGNNSIVIELIEKNSLIESYNERK